MRQVPGQSILCHALICCNQTSVFLLQGDGDPGLVVGHSSGDQTGSSDVSPSAIEGMLLMAVEKLYKEDRELDVQMGLLRVVLQVLQRHGKRCFEQIMHGNLAVLALIALLHFAQLCIGRSSHVQA